jgi:hypothetical protein
VGTYILREHIKITMKTPPCPMFIGLNKTTQKYGRHKRKIVQERR